MPSPSSSSSRFTYFSCKNRFDTYSHWIGLANWIWSWSIHLKPKWNLQFCLICCTNSISYLCLRKFRSSCIQFFAFVCKKLNTDSMNFPGKQASNFVIRWTENRKWVWNLFLWDTHAHAIDTRNPSSRNTLLCMKRISNIF